MNKSVREYMREMGAKGGNARSKSLTADARKAIARKAAAARWKKSPKR